MGFALPWANGVHVAVDILGAEGTLARTPGLADHRRRRRPSKPQVSAQTGAIFLRHAKKW